jgi:hypothetical protein
MFIAVTPASPRLESLDRLAEVRTVRQMKDYLIGGDMIGRDCVK